MKKILYKGLTLENIWVRGLVSCFYNENVCEIRDSFGRNYFCKTKTVCEFIGLYDQNNEEIFVGDILEDVNTRKTYCVVYQDGKYILTVGGCDEYITASQDFTKTCLIIRNINERLNTK